MGPVYRNCKRQRRIRYRLAASSNEGPKPRKMVVSYEVSSFPFVFSVLYFWIYRWCAGSNAEGAAVWLHAVRRGFAIALRTTEQRTSKGTLPSKQCIYEHPHRTAPAPATYLFREIVWRSLVRYLRRRKIVKLLDFERWLHNQRVRHLAPGRNRWKAYWSKPCYRLERPASDLGAMCCDGTQAAVSGIMAHSDAQNRNGGRGKREGRKGGKEWIKYVSEMRGGDSCFR